MGSCAGYPLKVVVAAWRSTHLPPHVPVCIVYSMDAVAELAQRRKALKAQLKEATRNLRHEAHACQFF